MSEADEYGPGGDRESGPQSEDSIIYPGHVPAYGASCPCDRCQCRAAATIPEQIALERRGVELMAAAVLREVAKQSIRRGRNVATATREAAQLDHLALRLERFADADE